MFTLFLLCLGTEGAGAQKREQIHVNCKVTLFNKLTKKEIHDKVSWGFCANMDAANKIVRNVESLSSSDDPLKVYDNLKRIKRDGKITRTTGNNGIIRDNFLPGMAVIVISDEDCRAAAFEVMAGQTEYEMRFEVQRLPGTKKTGVKKRIPRGTIIETDNGEERFNINIPIDKDLIKESTRLIIQTYAVDCLTEDTMDYCKPIVYEGENYHELQDKRMDFDYFKNDKLKDGYDESNVLYPGENAEINTTIIYKKPDIHRSYKGPSVFALEDYHHVYYKDSLGGSCLRIRPFKFLDFSVAFPDMELSTDFQEVAETQLGDVAIDLHLKFEVGKDVLTADSINQTEQENLIKELTLAGDELIAPAIVGTASPDGSDRVNRELAEKRARKAQSLIAPYLPRKARPSVKTMLYTWNDVADELERKRMRNEAQAVRDIVAANGNETAADQAMKKLEFYDTAIMPILEDMRVMKCTYSYIKEYVMNADEAVAAYYRDKKEYMSGKKRFSNGDYYNLYATITDSVELDTITMMAYNQLKKSSNIYSEKIAPYVYDRMARLQQRLGVPDTTILAPFIDQFETDTTYNKIDMFVTMKDGSEVKMNRRDICVTQAMNFYQLQQFKRAQEFVNWLKTANEPPAGLRRLEMFMTLKNKYMVAEDDQDFIEAKEFVMNSSDENKAILYTEIPEWRNTFKETDDLITRLDNSNPKKWYLKGILWASKTETEPSLSDFYVRNDDEFKILSKEEEDKLISEDYAAFEAYEKKLKEYREKHKDDEAEAESVDITNIKHYLAYFHQSFKMQPSYRQLYYNEGHIDEDMREKYKYLKKDFAGYDEVFKLLQVRDDRRRAELMPEEDGTAADETATGETATEGAEETGGGTGTGSSQPTL